MVQEFDRRDKSREEEEEDKEECERYARPPTPQGLVQPPKPRLPSERRLGQVRATLSSAFRSALLKLKFKQDVEWREQDHRIASDYETWASFYKTISKEFSALWDFFAVIEKDTPGWFRVAPLGGEYGFLGINPQGYNFAAGVERNFKPGAPFPKKWLIVSLGHDSGTTIGIGDERLLGRKETISPELVGLERCGHSLDPRVREDAARELKERAMRYPLLFQMSSEKVGQKAATVPVSILQQRSLVDLCQGLFIALNKDVLDDPLELIPEAEIASITW